MTPAPMSCPACGAGIKDHNEASHDEYEGWEFYCHGMILRMENGRLTPESDCGNAMRNAVNRLNDTCQCTPLSRYADAPHDATCPLRQEGPR